MNTFSHKRRSGLQKSKRDIGLKSLDLSFIYESSPVDSFMFQQDGEGVTLTSDITMLFNQKRLDRMTREAIIQRFDEFSVKNDSLSELRSKLSDDQLVSLVKSRYIQSPSELLAYSNYLVSRFSSMDKELKAFVEQQIQTKEQSTEQNPDQNTISESK